MEQDASTTVTSPLPPRHGFTHEQRLAALAALAANNGDVALTAEQLGINRITLYHWASGHRHPEARAAYQSNQQLLANAFEAAAWAMLGVMPAKFDRADFLQISKGLEIAIKNMLLLRGQPTSISQVDVSTMSDEVLQQELDRQRTVLAGLLPPPAACRQTGGADSGAAGASAASPSLPESGTPSASPRTREDSSLSDVVDADAPHDDTTRAREEKSISEVSDTGEQSELPDVDDTAGKSRTPQGD